MLEEILLDEPAKAKSKIYKHILEIDPGEYPIHYFEKVTGYSHIKTANLLQGINKELKEIEPTTALLNAKDKVVVVKQMPSHQQYQQFLFANGVPYRVLLASLLYPEQDLRDFGEQTGLSQSSLMRRLKPLVEYLKTKDIRLNCLQMEITGRESFIRLMYFNFFWSVDFGTRLYEYFDEVWGRSLDSFMAPEDLVYLKYVEKREFSMYHGLSFLRTRQEYYVDEPQINRLNYPATNHQFKEALEAEGVPETYREREANFINYMIFYWPQYFAYDDPRLTIVKRQYRTLTKSKEQAQLVASRIQEKLAITNKAQQELFLLNLQTIFARWHLLGSKVPRNLDFIMERLKGLDPEFNQFFEQVNQALAGIATDEVELVNVLTITCLNAYHSGTTAEKLKVGIVGFPNHFLLYAMINRIDSLPFVEFSLMNTASEETFDAVITCSTELLPANVKAYWVVEGVASFDAMENFLFQLYKEKSNRISTALVEVM